MNFEENGSRNENDSQNKDCCCGWCSRRCCTIWLFVMLIPIVILIIVVPIVMFVGYKPLEPFLEVEGYASFGPFDYGYPVWSNDDSSNSVAGIEMQYNEGLVFPPLQGWTGRTNPRFKVFVQILDEPQTRNDIFQSKGNPRSLFYMKKQNYVLINYEQKSTIVTLLDDDGTIREGYTMDVMSKTDFGSNTMVHGSHYRGSIPSRDGSVIAGIVQGGNSNYIQVVFAYLSFKNDVKKSFDVSYSKVMDVTFNDHGTEAYYTNTIFWDNTSPPTLVLLQEARYNGNYYPSTNHARVHSENETIAFSTKELTCTPYLTSSGRVRTFDSSSVLETAFGGNGNGPELVDVNRTTNEIITRQFTAQEAELNPNNYDCMSIY